MGTPPSYHSFMYGFSIINHPFWGILILGSPHMYVDIYIYNNDNNDDNNNTGQAIG